MAALAEAAAIATRSNEPVYADYSRSAPGNTEDFHAVGDYVERSFQISKVVYADGTGSVNNTCNDRSVGLGPGPPF